LISGVVFLDKPIGWTSRKAVSAVSRLFDRAKAGHAGTLDPLATGMLPILLGEATRFSQFGLVADKTYEFSMDLSFQTDTLDKEGEVMQHFSVPDLDIPAIEYAIRTLAGRRQQVPPDYSAIRVGGRHAYDLARQGRPVDLPSREIFIHDLRLIDWKTPVLQLRAHCSKGTYIRSLARDLGELLQGGGCVLSLRRLSIGCWREDLMIDMSALERDRDRGLNSLSFWLRDVPRLDLEPDLVRRFLHGQRLPVQKLDQGVVAVYHGHILLGIAEVRGAEGMAVLHPKRILPSAQRRFI